MGFSDSNKRIAQRIERWYLNGLNMESAYKEAIHNFTDPKSFVLDAGAGKRSFDAGEGLRVVGVDVRSADLAENADIKHGVAANLSKGFPFRPESFDAVTACYFIEHIPDTEEFARNAATVLKPNGKLFLLFPCRYAPFAVFNRMIPNKWTVKLLHDFLKEPHGGFPAMYSNCWPNGMRKVLERNGFRIVHKKVCHYQAFYCSTFLPFYLLSLAYDATTRALKNESLASSVLIVAQRIGHDSTTASQ